MTGWDWAFTIGAVLVVALMWWIDDDRKQG